MSKKIIIGISGASGVIYGVKLLSVLMEKDIETHLIISESGEKNLQIETDYQIDDVKQMASYVYNPKNMGAKVSSGSFLVDGMVVVPCTIKTLSGIANSYSENLIVRAADVTLKEKRKLLLVVRETPLHKGHLNLMLKASDHGAQIMPPVPSFYHNPKTIDDIIDQTIGKILDYFNIEHHLFQRWGE
ncbi:MAG: UbiX family flavin prenyltransferase [Fidelibacterota bacterium]